MSVKAKREEQGTKLVVDKILNGSFTRTSFREQVIKASYQMLEELKEYPDHLWSVDKVTIDFEKGIVESELTSKSTLQVVSNSYSVK